MILYPRISRMAGTILIKCFQKVYVASRGAGIFVTLDPHFGPIVKACTSLP